MYLNIIPATKLPLSRPQHFTYSVPSFLTVELTVGQIVEIPLHTRMVYGVIQSITKKKPKFKTKPILALHPDNLSLEPYQLKFASELADYFLVSLGLVVKLMIPAKTKMRTKTKNVSLKIKKQPLDQPDKGAIKTIKKNSKENFLLKTNNAKSVSLELIKHCINNNKQALLLLPDVPAVKEAFHFYKNHLNTKQISTWNSKLSRGQLYENWLNTNCIQTKLVIGTRSAIFLPFRKLGLIVINDEHDSSYKQWDQAPRYHARQACYNLSKLTGAQFVLTSSTPSINSLFSVKNDNLTFIESSQAKRKINIVDMNDERRKGNYSIFATKTLTSLTNIVKGSKQAIIFNNRYGTSGITTCRDCGHTIKCSGCKVPLVYYQDAFSGDKEQLVCHYCKKHIPSPALCPKCKSTKLKSFGVGLEKINQEIKKLFPKAKTAMLKSDNNQQAYRDFNDQKINFLLATQVISKQPFQKKADYVIINNPDLMLNQPDFKSCEKTWQTLAKITNLADNSIIQTNDPGHFVYTSLAANNDRLFYNKELQNRQELTFPPYSQFVKLIYRDKSQGSAINEAKKLFKLLGKIDSKDLTVYPPSFSQPEKIRGKYNIFINIKIFQQEQKKSIKKIIPNNWQVDVMPDSLL